MIYTGMLEEVGCIKELKKQKRENRKLKKRVEELDNSLSIALEVNDKYQRENEKLKEDLARAKEDHQKELESLRKK